MADLSQHTNYTGAYSGLLDNLWVTIAIAGVCLLGHEVEVHVPRRRGRDGTFQRIPVRVVLAAKKAWYDWRSRRRKNDEVEKGQFPPSGNEKGGPDELSRAREDLGSRESWEFGYIFQPKAWRLNPSPPVPKWPLEWIVSTLRVKESDMPDTCGLDHTLHMRLLRGTFFYVLLQACVVLPILMPVHIFYAPDSVSKTSMTRAGISSLVESSGAHWLWIHAVLIWWITITWTLTILWITWGGLGYRKRELRRLAMTVERSKKAKRQTTGQGTPIDVIQAGNEEPEGAKRFRTLMIENIPPDMRNEQVLRTYFDHYLHRHRVRSGEATPSPNMDLSDEKGKIMRHVHFKANEIFKKQQETIAGPMYEPKSDLPRAVTGDDFDMVDDASVEGVESEVNEIVLVRKLGPVASLRARRTAVLRQLEIAHVKLAQRILHAVSRYQLKHPVTIDQNICPVHDVDKGIDGLNAQRDQGLPVGITKEEKLEKLAEALGGFVGDQPQQLGEAEDTVWDVLHSLPRELLDPYQALTHFRVTSVLRKSNAPLIDYLTTKLNYLTHRLDEARNRPLSSYSSSSTAFVTFKDAQTARIALKVLASHPTRTLACRASQAPDWTNLLWPRLSMSIYRSEFVRKWVVSVGVWVFTLIWIFPVSVLCALSSFTNIAGFINPLKHFLSSHARTASAISSLAPVILVAGLTLCICPILLVIANKAETINTRLAVHNSVLERFWKFLMVNGVVFFAIGQSAIEAYLTAFQNAEFDPLPVVASAFPTAAPYFASYVLLQVAIQPFFEIFRFGLPTIIYVFGTRVSVIPRQRRARTEYPTFSHFSQVPQQLLAAAIMHLFMLLNPLVIPFCLVYYGACYVVWKRQFTYVYGRLYENGGKRTSIRLVRYSLDALALAQFVLFAFFILNKAKGHAIATGVLFFLTLIEKLVITRAVRRRHENLESEEADLICPPVNGAKHPIPLEMDAPASDEPIDQPTVAKGLSGHISRWFHKWVYAFSHHTGVGYRRPIPFDHVLFGFLDRKFTFNVPDTPPASVTRSETDDELKHAPDHAIIHPMATKLVTRHYALRPWEDIPPYPRSRGYNDQPAYTDDYDDFLWLPRDPLSTLDLDDTVEMRLSLTTSAGGNGRIGDWPPAYDDEEILNDSEDVWPEDEDTVRPSNSEELPPISPSVSSAHGLIEHLQIPHDLGSEADNGAGGLMRRGTRKVTDGFDSVFRRHRANTNRTDRTNHTGLGSMRTSSANSLRGRRASFLSTAPPPTQASPMSGLPTPDFGPGRTVRPFTGDSLLSGGSGFDNYRLFHANRLPSTSKLLQQSGPAENTVDLTEPVEGMGGSPEPPSPTTRPALGSPIAGQSSSSLSVHPAHLGRSASGRRPSRFRDATPSTPGRSAQPEGNVDFIPQASPSGQPQRSTSSIYAPGRNLSRSRTTFSRGMERNGTASLAQQALMNEIMEEERIAAKSSKHREAADNEREAGEVMKEQERLRRVSKAIQMGVMLGRAGSKRADGPGSAGPAVDGVDGRNPSGSEEVSRSRSRSFVGSLQRRLTGASNGSAGMASHRSGEARSDGSRQSSHLVVPTASPGPIEPRLDIEANRERSMSNTGTEAQQTS